MSNFEDRERRFESEFAHDAERRFRVESRRNKLVGMWAAEKLGLSGDKAEEFAKAVVRADMEEAGDEDVFRKLRSELNSARDAVSDDDIRAKMSEFLGVAMDQIKEGK